MSTTISVLLYGVDVLKRENRRKVLVRMHSTVAIRVTLAYRIMSGDAILVIGDNVSINLLTYERKKMWELKKEYENND